MLVLSTQSVKTCRALFCTTRFWKFMSLSLLMDRAVLLGKHFPPGLISVFPFLSFTRSSSRNCSRLRICTSQQRTVLRTRSCFSHLVVICRFLKETATSEPPFCLKLTPKCSKSSIQCPVTLRSFHHMQSLNENESSTNGDASAQTDGDTIRFEIQPDQSIAISPSPSQLDLIM